MFSSEKFLFVRLIDSKESSTKIISLDPRERSSKPIAPVPQKQSSTTRLLKLLFLAKIYSIKKFYYQKILICQNH